MSKSTSIVWGENGKLSNRLSGWNRTSMRLPQQRSFSFFSLFSLSIIHDFGVDFSRLKFPSHTIFFVHYINVHCSSLIKAWQNKNAPARAIVFFSCYNFPLHTRTQAIFLPPFSFFHINLRHLEIFINFARKFPYQQTNTLSSSTFDKSIFHHFYCGTWFCR